MDDRKSTFEFAFFMRNIVFSWMSKKQPIVTLFTCEAEFVAASTYVSHAIWLRNLLKEVGSEKKKPTKINIDSKSAIVLGKNLVYHQRSKHIDICFHSIQEHVKNKEVELLYVKTQDQVADMFTKPLKVDLFIKFKISLGMIKKEQLSLRGDVES